MSRTMIPASPMQVTAKSRQGPGFRYCSRMGYRQDTPEGENDRRKTLLAESALVVDALNLGVEVV